jgi:hypothetical protein
MISGGGSLNTVVCALCLNKLRWNQQREMWVHERDNNFYCLTVDGFTRARAIAGEAR